MSAPPPRRLVERGVIAWMTHNRVTPNILMLVLLVGGFLMASTIKQEVFPEFELDYVTVTVAYPGASPEEVEQGIVLVVETAVRGLAGVKQVTARAREGSATITVELIEGIDRQAAYQDIQAEVGRITTFPDDAERPQVKLSQRRRDVLELQLYGDAPEWALRDLAERVRDQLLQDPGITQVDLEGARDYEVHVEVSRADLRAHGLTLEQIARTIEANATEVPAGSIETRAGDLLLRFAERKDWAREFADIPVISTASGAALRLGDIARVEEGFAESNRLAAYNGTRSIGLEIYRVGEETPIGVSEAVRGLLPGIEETLRSTASASSCCSRTPSSASLWCCCCSACSWRRSSPSG